MIVTVSGAAASGKSTLAKALAKRLGFKHISAGVLMRQMAEEKGMNLVDFSEYAKSHPEVDHEIDERQKKLAKDNDCVVDGRISRFFLEPDISIWLIAPAKVRANRVLGRGEKYSSEEDAEKDMLARDASETSRYKEFYDIDLEDLSVYDLVISTDRFDIAKMTELAHFAVKLLI